MTATHTGTQGCCPFPPLHLLAPSPVPPALLCPPRGVEPYDKPTTVYIERHEPSGASTAIRSTDFFQSRENKEIILEDVEDFQLRDKYMFATKSVVSGSEDSLLRVDVVQNHSGHEHLPGVVPLSASPPSPQPSLDCHRGVTQPASSCHPLWAHSSGRLCRSPGGVSIPQAGQK